MSLKFKRHYPILAALILLTLLLTFGLGEQRIVAYTAQGTLDPAAISYSYTNAAALFDNAIAHSIQILMPDEDY